MNEESNEKTQGINRRDLFGIGLGLAATAVLPSTALTQHQQSARRSVSIGRRKLGKLEVSEIGMGVQNMHRKYDTTVPDRREMVRILRAAHERGITFFDTAEAYGPWENERILGEAIAPFRDKVQITSKFGWNIDQETGQRRPGLNSKPEHVKQVVENSLKRLNRDHIDLLYQHRVDPEVPIEDVAGAVKELMDQGKVRHWGLCEMGLNTLRRAHAVLPRHSGPERILDGDARPGKGGAFGMRGTWHWFCALVAPRLPTADRLDRRKHSFCPRRHSSGYRKVRARKFGPEHEIDRAD